MSLLTDTFGCLFISMLLTFILYGMVLVLGAQYFRQYPSDSLAVRFTVVVFLIVGTIHIASGFAWIYDSLIDKFGQLLKLDLIPVTALMQMGSIFFLSFFSQCFFGMRIWILSKKNFFMTVPVFLLAVAQFTLAMWALARVAIYGRLSAIFRVKDIIIAQDTLTVTDDLLITAELCYLLHRNRSGIRATDSLITRLLVAALNRGIITSFLAALSLALYLYNPVSMIFEIPTNLIGQVYILSVLSMLLSRRSLRNRFSRKSHSFSVPEPYTPTSESFNLSSNSRSKGTIQSSKLEHSFATDEELAVDVELQELEYGHTDNPSAGTTPLVVTLHKEVSVQ